MNRADIVQSSRSAMGLSGSVVNGRDSTCDDLLAIAFGIAPRFKTRL